MPGRDYQLAVRPLLQRHFDDVRLEWSVTSNATDALQRDPRRYAPRVDIAIGPFNTAPGRDAGLSEELLPACLRPLFQGLPPNRNPRCLLAIEVIYSGSSKHMMGDTLNAGALGLYGLVIGAAVHVPKIRRIGEYLQALAELEKLPSLFRNVVALSTDEFEALLRS